MKKRTRFTKYKKFLNMEQNFSKIRRQENRSKINGMLSKMKDWFVKLNNQI